MVLPYHGSVTAAHAHELPPESGDELVRTPEEVAAVERGGEIVILTRGGRPVAKVHSIDPDHAWFWTPQWQAREREVDEEPVRIFWPTWKPSLKIHPNCEPNVCKGTGVRSRICETY